MCSGELCMSIDPGFMLRPCCVLWKLTMWFQCCSCVLDVDCYQLCGLWIFQDWNSVWNSCKSSLLCFALMYWVISNSEICIRFIFSDCKLGHWIKFELLSAIWPRIWHGDVDIHSHTLGFSWTCWNSASHLCCVLNDFESSATTYELTLHWYSWLQTVQTESLRWTDFIFMIYYHKLDFTDGNLTFSLNTINLLDHSWCGFWQLQNLIWMISI